MGEKYEAMVEWAGKTEQKAADADGLSSEKGPAGMTPSPRDVALRVEKFLEDNYGEACSHRNVAEGLWLAAQLVCGPFDAACVLRQCGVNFADK